MYSSTCRLSEVSPKPWTRPRLASSSYLSIVAIISWICSNLSSVMYAHKSMAFADLSTTVNQIYISRNDLYYSQILSPISQLPSLTCAVFHSPSFYSRQPLAHIARMTSEYFWVQDNTECDMILWHKKSRELLGLLRMQTCPILHFDVRCCSSWDTF